MPLNENQKPDENVPVKEVARDVIVKHLETLVEDAASRKQLVGLLAKDKPKGWRRITNAPYFRERFGLEFKIVIDAMMKDGEDRIYRYDQFKGLSKTSLYLRVNQSRLYLLEQLDPHGTYKDFLEQISITRERTGVRLSFHKDIRNNQQLIPEKVITTTSFEETHGKIDEFLEKSKPGDEFLLNKLSLTPDEMHTFEASFQALENFVYHVTPTYIKLVRIS